MPHIGKRIIKTAVAVFLCFCIDLLRDGNGIVQNAAIAAIICMQPSVSDSTEVGWNRVLGTLVGGLAGGLFVLIENSLVPAEWLILHYFLISLCIIPVIYITVFLRHSSTAQLACVVFLIIAIPRNTGTNPFFFTANRMLDTLIGICVSLVVNVGGFMIVKKDRRMNIEEKEKVAREKVELENVELEKAEREVIAAVKDEIDQDVHPGSGGK